MKKLVRAKALDIIIKAFFLLAFPAAWASGFSGIKYLCIQIHSGKPLEMTPFVMVLIGLLVFTIVFGRFFCSRACAFGTYGDVMFFIRTEIARALKKKPPVISDKISQKAKYIKYAILIAVCLLCMFGYDKVVTEGSPWTTFSHIITLKFGVEKTVEVVGFVLFILCSIGMMMDRRFFCRYLCPFGGVFALMPVLLFSMVRRKKSDCISGCSACKNICPANLDLPYSDDAESHSHQFAMGECFQCGKCTNICPKENACCPAMPGGTKGIVFDIAKAAILATMLYLIGV